MEANYDIVITDHKRRMRGLMGSVIRPLVNGVEAELENGEIVSLRNRNFDYLAEKKIEISSQRVFGV